MKWDKLIEQKPSRAFREKVLDSASAELAKLRPSSREWMVPSRRWYLSGAAAAIFLVLLRNLVSSNRHDPSVAIAQLDHEMLENAEMLQHLEMMADLDILEDWNGEGA